MKVIKTTALKLVEAVGWEFSAKVLEVNKTSIRLAIGDYTYSIKTPKDFEINNIKKGDEIEVTYEIIGDERINLLIADIREANDVAADESA